MCLFSILIAVFGIVEDCFPLSWNISAESPELSIIMNPFTAVVLEEFFSLMLVVQWLLFVEYTLHQSLELIRRRYPVVIIPFFATVFIHIFRIVLAFQTEISDEVVIVATVLVMVSRCVMIFYLIAAFVAVQGKEA